MAAFVARIRYRLSTIALAIVFICVVVGLYVADDALRESDKASAELDATQTASELETFFTVRTEALGALRAVYLDPSGQVDSVRLVRLMTSAGDHLKDFRSVWVTDSSGALVQQHLIDPSAAQVPRGLDLDTLQRLGIADVVQQARSAVLAQVSRPGVLPSGGRGFVLVDPVLLGGQLAGFLVGEITEQTLRDAVLRRTSNRRIAMRVIVESDTVLAVSPTRTPSSAQVHGETARIPGRRRWRAEVTHASSERSERFALWAVALGAMTALSLGLFYERRQARRIADRSSELEHLSAELLRANRAKSEFLANVSHELRTPLNAIVGFVDLLRDGVYGELGPRQVGPVERIEASANHLRHLVDQILDLAKIAAGRLEVHTETLDLRPFVFDVASEVESLINEKGLSLSLAVGTTLPRVRTDPTHLRQILVNLLGNAIKFTAAGGITVRGRLVGLVDKPAHSAAGQAAAAMRARSPQPDALWIALQVADTGAGIPEKDHERIFEEFEQVNAGPRGDSMRRGTGLGLSISRRLARLLGGDITLESEVGRGSVFTVWLPVDPADLRGDRAA